MPKFHYTNFLSGPNVNAGLFALEDNGLTQLNGCLISHELGSIIKDVGYYRIGNAALEASKTITGLHNFRQDASTQKMLATCNDSTDDDTQLFYSTGGNWTEVTAAETAWANVANANVEMEDFISYCFFVGHSSADGFLPPRSLTGTTLGTTNTSSMPNAKYIKRYRDRLYIANCDISATAYPYRVYYSSVPSSGSITWTTATDFIDVDYSEEITGIGENWDRLMIFTEFSAYMYDQTVKKKVWDVGCSNHRTIRNAGAYMMWANRDGVWVSTGGRPENIAGRMMEFIRAGNPRNFFAEVVDEEYHLYLGTVTVKGITYTNCKIVYNIPTNTWRWRELHDDMKIFAAYNSSGELRLWMGDDSGMVWDKNKHTDSGSPTLYYADAIIPTGGDADTTGKPINSRFETKMFDFGDPSIRKKIKDIVAYSDRAGDLKIKSRIVDSNNRVVAGYRSIGGLARFINKLSARKLKKGHFLQISGTENSTDPYWSLYGFTVDVEPFGEGVEKNT